MSIIEQHMDQAKLIPTLIIALTGVTSYMGFANNGNNQLFDRLKFHVGAILGRDKQWDRILSSAFLHADWMHLLFNMMTLYFFAPFVIMVFGVWKFLIIYASAIIGGGLLSLWMHRKEYSYSAIGASGGVVGVLFSVIAVAPHIEIYIMFIPVGIPAWIFGIGYLCFSIYGMRNQYGNIGHEAHLGGAAVGLIMAIMYAPQTLFTNTVYIVANIIPLIILGYFIWKER